RDRQSVQDFRQVPARELHVDDGSDDLGDPPLVLQRCHVRLRCPRMEISWVRRRGRLYHGHPSPANAGELAEWAARPVRTRAPRRCALTGTVAALRGVSPSGALAVMHLPREEGALEDDPEQVAQAL